MWCTQTDLHISAFLSCYSSSFSLIHSKWIASSGHTDGDCCSVSKISMFVITFPRSLSKLLKGCKDTALLWASTELSLSCRLSSRKISPQGRVGVKQTCGSRLSSHRGSAICTASLSRYVEVELWFSFLLHNLRSISCQDLFIFCQLDQMFLFRGMCLTKL